MITMDTFSSLEMRVGTILEVKENELAQKPSYILRVDFGENIGILQTSAQITENYSPSSLTGTQIVGLINIPEKQVAKTRSQFLMLAALNQNQAVLLRPDFEVENGSRIA